MKRALFFLIALPIVTGLVSACLLAAAREFWPESFAGSLGSTPRLFIMVVLGVMAVSLPAGMIGLGIFSMARWHDCGPTLTAFLLRMSLVIALTCLAFIAYGYASGGPSRLLRFALFSAWMVPLGFFVSLGLWPVRESFGMKAR